MIRAIIVLLVLIVLFLVLNLFKHRSKIDGYLDIVQEKDGATAMLIELKNADVINKKTVKLEVRKSQKIQGVL